MTRFSKALAGIAGGAALAAFAAAPALAFTASPITNLASPADNAGTTDRVEVVRGPGVLDGSGNALPNDVSGGTLTINFSGFAVTAGPVTYKPFLCNPKASAVYDGTLDCIELAGNTVLSATGAGVMNNIRVGDGGFFKRRDGQRSWQCAEVPVGSVVGVQDGIDYGNGTIDRIYSECFVVVRNVSGANNDTAPANNELFPVRFVADTPPPSVPEAPYAALMPAAAIAVAGGAYLIVRRRAHAAA